MERMKIPIDYPPRFLIGMSFILIPLIKGKIHEAIRCLERTSGSGFFLDLFCDDGPGCESEDDLSGGGG
jgi:hypothetical protein